MVYSAHRFIRWTLPGLLAVVAMFLHALPATAEIPQDAPANCCMTSAAPAQSDGESPDGKADGCRAVCPAGCCHPPFAVQPVFSGLLLCASDERANLNARHTLSENGADPPLQPPRA